MKNIILFCYLLGSILILGCQKEGTDTWYDTTLDERLSDTLEARKSALTSASYGWKTVFTPEGGGAYLFYMKFHPDNRVDMVSDINVETASEANTSSFILRMAGQPSLVFDTYNALHILSHPYNPISGGTGGQGKVSDYEFFFKSISMDSIVLVGVKNKNIMVLKKASQEEEDFYRNGGIKTVIDEASTSFKNKTLHLIEDGEPVAVDLNFQEKRFSLIRLDANGEEVVARSGFTFASDGLDLLTPLLYNNQTFDKVYWDNTNKSIYLMVDGQRVPVIAVAPPPLHTLLGDPAYRFLMVDPPTMPQSGKFNDLFQIDLAATALVGRNYNHFYFDFAPNLTNGANVIFGVTTSTSTYWIEYNYYKMEYVDEEAGIFKFTFLGNNGSIPATLTYSKELRAYFENHTFRLEYSDEPSINGNVMAEMRCVEEPDAFFYGRFEGTWRNW